MTHVLKIRPGSGADKRFRELISETISQEAITSRTVITEEETYIEHTITDEAYNNIRKYLQEQGKAL